MQPACIPTSSLPHPACQLPLHGVSVARARCVPTPCTMPDRAPKLDVPCRLSNPCSQSTMLVRRGSDLPQSVDQPHLQRATIELAPLTSERPHPEGVIPRGQPE